MRKFLSLLLLLSTAVGANAHEGHGHTEGFTVKHYFIEAEHILPAILAVVAAFVLFRVFRKPATEKKNNG